VAQLQDEYGNTVTVEPRQGQELHLDRRPFPDEIIRDHLEGAKQFIRKVIYFEVLDANEKE
jgi:hypothetical protein